MTEASGTTAHHTAGSTSASHSAQVTAAARIVSGAMSCRHGTARNIYRSPVEEIIARFPSAAAFARAAGVHNHTVYHWRNSGYIPRKSRQRVAALIGVSPDDLPRVRKPLQALVERAGGVVALAEVAGVHFSTITYWRRTGEVPKHHHARLLEAGLLP